MTKLCQGVSPVGVGLGPTLPYCSCPLPFSYLGSMMVSPLVDLPGRIDHLALVNPALPPPPCLYYLSAQNERLRSAKVVEKPGSAKHMEMVSAALQKLLCGSFISIFARYFLFAQKVGFPFTRRCLHPPPPPGPGNLGRSCCSK